MRNSVLKSLGLAVMVVALTISALAAQTTSSGVVTAAERGDTEALRTLLKDGADVNATQGDGMTALHWTALNGDLKTMNVLMYAGAAIDPLTRVGRYTPLHLASSRGHAAIVARLLDAGAAPRAVTATGVQPIHFAAESGSVDAVKALLDKGADINVADTTHGRTPLVFAVSGNRVEAAKLLLSKGADVKLSTKVIDYRARAAEDNQARQTRDRVFTAATGRASQSNNNLNAEPPPGAAAAGRGGAGGGVGGGRGEPAIDPAAAGGRGGGRFGGRGGGGPRPPSDVEQMGRQGGFTALHYAARDGYADAAAALIAGGLDVNVRTAGDRSTPILVATINGNFDLAADLLKRGADPNLASEDGMTPLFAALNNEWALRTWYPQPTAGKQQQKSHLQLMEALLKAGADPNARMKTHVWHASYNTGRMGVDFAGATAFWRAAYSLDVDAMRLLTKYGADPNLATMSYGAALRPNDPSGLPAVPTGGPHVPAFHAASGVGYGTSRVAQQHQHVPDGWMPAAKYFLEELGVDVNVRDSEGFTALHHAAARGDNEMIKYLVSKGANVMAVNRAGQTTVDMANSPEQRTQPFPETIKLLEGMGAKNNHNCRACK